MMNLDARNNTLYSNFVESLKSDNEATVKAAVAEMMNGVAQQVLSEAKELAGEQDAAVLAQIGRASCRERV